MLVLIMKGKAKTVFQIWGLFVQKQGHKTLGELAKR